ncbi:MAG: TIGR02921 family PEP-CTERM protein, partial [Ardenticatenaceae bacterium]
YGVEGPLMLLLAVRFFVVQDMTPGVALLMAIAGIGMATLLWQLLDWRIGERGALLSHLRVIGLTLLLAVGLYASVWLAFYAVPFGAMTLEWVGGVLGDLPTALAGGYTTLRRAMLDGLRWVPLLVLGSILLGYTATLLIGMPLTIPVLYVRAWRAGVRDLTTRYGTVRSGALVTLTLVVVALLFVWSNRQPQGRAFALLAEPPTTADQAQALLRQEGAIRAGLLNAYLAPQRYWSAVGGVRHIADMYEQTLHLPRARAKRVQQWYETIAQPVLYRPAQPESSRNEWGGADFQNESTAAAERYRQFFDQPIHEGERAAVVRAARSTWSPGLAQAAWQAVDDREVHLLRQEITVAEHGDWAEIELYEVYQNQTAQRQEVVYYFGLPESAVITGVWLGEGPEREERFAYHVAPRGAAQEVYRREVVRNVDPALVEQIGPRQYRLRVFPVEPLQWRWDDTSARSTMGDAPPLHLWLTWRVMWSENSWPLPRLAELRNVYWDDATVRLLNGQPLGASAEDWLPASVPASGFVAPMTHRVDFPTGESVLAQPTDNDEPLPSTENLRLAVVLDRSRSMAEVEPDVQAALARLTEATETADLYLTTSSFTGEAPSRLPLREFRPEQLLFFGGQNAAELLAQFNALRGDDVYDAILVLTDGSGYELTDPGIAVPRPEASVWMVHLGGYPLGYDDPTLEAIQASGGGVAGSVGEALTRLAVARATAGADVVDTYLWQVVPTETVRDLEAVTHDASDPFAAFAARRLILAAMQRHGPALADPEILDGLHEIAIAHSIITPYSSMIVLVNERQEKMLEAASARGDRFEREYEAAGETIPGGAPPITGVPEPEEWLLLALGAALLLWHTRHRFGLARLAA